MALSNAVKFALYGLGTVAAVLLGKEIVDLIMGSSSSSSQAEPAPSCSTKYTSYNHGATRDTSTIRIIVLHATDPSASDAEPTAESTASWFSQQIPISAGGPFSAHVVVGEDGCFQTTDDSIIAYGAGSPANEKGLHIEQAGHSFWTRDQWLSHDATLRQAGGQVAAWAEQYGIPLVFLTGDDLQNLAAAGWPEGQGGITTHAEVSKAWPKASNHTDPGANYPIDVLMGYAGATQTSDEEPST